MLPIVNRATARKAKTRHQFIPGLGYIEHQFPPDIPPGAKGGKNCTPPAGTAGGTIHIMRPSHGAPEISMRWVPAEGAWAPLKLGAGNRLAWTADHLSRAGWEYVGLDEGAEGSKRKR